MNDTVIQLTLKASPEELLRVSGSIGSEAVHVGWLRARSIFSVAAGPVAAGIFAAMSGFNVGHAVLFGAFAVSVLLAVERFACKVAGRSYLHHLRASALRQRPTQATLTAQGLTIEAAPHSWSRVTEVRRLKTMTLLLFSPVDAFVIRDEDLPDGMSPEALLALVCEWRA